MKIITIKNIIEAIIGEMTQMLQRKEHFCLAQSTPSIWAERAMLIVDGNYTSKREYGLFAD
jgi:Mg2+/Co2+ transporter CorB